MTNINNPLLFCKSNSILIDSIRDTVTTLHCELREGHSGKHKANMRWKT